MAALVTLFQVEFGMDRYHIALFLHLLTLIVAAGTTAVTKLAVSRRIRSRTVGEVLEWHTVLMSASKTFPICLAAFVITGSYMLSVANVHVWTTGFVVAGFVGVALLLASGIYLSMKGKALKSVLENMAKAGADRPAPKLVPPLLVAGLPVVNTGIALAVAFDMTTKPTSVAIALLIIALGALAGAASAMRRRPARAMKPATIAGELRRSGRRCLAPRRHFAAAREASLASLASL
jgi:hypothetical protein